MLAQRGSTSTIDKVKKVVHPSEFLLLLRENQPIKSENNSLFISLWKHTRAYTKSELFSLFRKDLGYYDMRMKYVDPMTDKNIQIGMLTR